MTLKVKFMITVKRCHIFSKIQMMTLKVKFIKMCYFFCIYKHYDIIL